MLNGVQNSVNKLIKQKHSRIRHHLNSIVTKMSVQITWHQLTAKPQELRLGYTLIIGQCFNWKRFYNKTEECWLGDVENQPVLLKQTGDTVEYSCLTPDVDAQEVGASLSRFFQLEYSLTDLYRQWIEKCDRMRVIAQHLPGVRVIRQDPWECLISFVCSSCNNIPRITQMLDKLRYHYGVYQCSLAVSQRGEIKIISHPEYEQFRPENTVDAPTSSCDQVNGRPIRTADTKSGPDRNTSNENDDNTATNIDTLHHLFSFPSPETLAAAAEDDLRLLGMGYRAKFIVGTARMVVERGRESALAGGAREWLHQLRTVTGGNLADNGSAADGTVSVKTEKVRVKIEPDAVYVKQESYAKEEVDSSTSHAVSAVKVKVEVKSEPGITDTAIVDGVIVDSAQLHRHTVRQALLQFPGVGPKVADCVALFSLDVPSMVPVDTHVWSIACRDYAPELLQHKSLTPKVYECVGDALRARFGPKTGWAMSLLFAAELPEFRKLLPIELQKEMKVFAESQKASKKDKKEVAAVAKAIKLEAKVKIDETVVVKVVEKNVKRKRKVVESVQNDDL